MLKRGVLACKQIIILLTPQHMWKIGQQTRTKVCSGSSKMEEEPSGTGKSEGMLPNTEPIIHEKTIPLYSPHSGIYWKMNYIFGCHEPNTSPYSRTDSQIEEQSLTEHRRVFIQLQNDLTRESSASGYPLPRQHPVKGNSLLGKGGNLSKEWLDSLLDGQEWQKKQRMEFERMLKKNTIWGKIMYELLSAVSVANQPILSSIFYVGFKIFRRVSENNFLSQEKIIQILALEKLKLVEELSHKIPSLSHSPLIQETVLKMVYTVMAACCGFFHNVYHTKQMAEGAMKEEPRVPATKLIKKKLIIRRRPKIH